MRLHELLDMGRAAQEGALLEVVLNRLRTEARTVLLGSGAFLSTGFKAVADQIRAALNAAPDRPDQFLPGGRNYATVQAALDVLNQDVRLVDVVADALDEQAAAAKDWVALAALDETIMLLDDELAYEGQSRAWRARAAEDVEVAICEGWPLGEAVKVIVAVTRQGWPHDIQFVFPIRALADRRETVLTNRLQDATLMEEIFSGWPDLPDGVTVDLGAFEIVMKNSSDLESGLERAEDWLERQIGLWRLQGGDVRVDDAVLWHDRGSGTVGRIARPLALPLLPPNLGKLDVVLVGDPDPIDDPSRFISTLPDAIVQLSQARSSARGAALADLWTVAEAVFAGHAAEVSAEAAGVMSEVAQFLYPELLLAWLADGFTDLALVGVNRDAALSAHAWALEVFESHGGTLFQRLESDERHALLYVRAKAFSAWSSGARMEEDLAELGGRMRRVADRAYLVRNFFIHAAQPSRARALGVTLPVFADLLTACLGFVTADSDRIDDPIPAAKLAAMRVARAAGRYAAEKPGDTAILRGHLGL